ncbi:hypothetical protein SAMN05216201_113111 [Pseudomonas linyingensis]|uniref:pEK499-p136 HEPN domain-containing protein n=1 Tax=Pseudomonas linyingensis TaxID=915471 RepID=A0A1H7AXD6_9PSED|nr:hypothetical protein [Pseudomonas linyingensis]SEJ66540.1 hypothetical protein SAMN05216201_113111 [Pseudomonas linyingensis]
MEYFREPSNKIQAGFALNAGKLLNQYRTLTTNLQPMENYDSTLTICVLQSLLANCAELLDAMSSSQKKIWSENVHEVPRRRGITSSFIVDNTFPTEVTYADFVKHLRNALSHPTSTEKTPNHPATGYTTLPDDSGVISRFRFTDSPWVDRGRIHSRYSSSDLKKMETIISSFQGKHGDIGLEIKKKQQTGKYEIFRNNKIYLPVFIAELSLASLTELAIELANHLAQPVIEGWNGISIQRLVG